MEPSEQGIVAATEGWFVVNVRDAAWVTSDYFADACIIEGDATLRAASFLANRGHFNVLYVMLTAGVASTLFNEAAFHTARLWLVGVVPESTRPVRRLSRVGAGSIVD